ncbi:MAG TPA: GyrI-like domain-containing protein [Gemmatimonadales bacterium]|nr:GyrI-like domain-containing protein [Gemmatimonadales bacterium]
MTPNPRHRRAEPQRIAGLTTRTTNAAESSRSTATIPSLWGRFMSEEWLQRLAALGGFGPTIAVYSAYESDVTGSYQLLLGRQVPSTSLVASPLHLVSSPAGSYLVFQCLGPLPQAVIDGWRDVWGYFERQPAAPRAYTYDFEIYRDGGPVEIWVAVRDA